MQKNLASYPDDHKKFKTLASSAGISIKDAIGVAVYLMERKTPEELAEICAVSNALRIKQ